MFDVLNTMMIGIYILVIPIVLYSVKQAVSFIKELSEDTEEW